MFYSMQDSEGFGAGLEVLGEEGLLPVMGQTAIDPGEAAFLTQLKAQQDAQYAAAYSAAAASPMTHTNSPVIPAFQFPNAPYTNTPNAPVGHMPLAPYTGLSPISPYEGLVSSGRRRRRTHGKRKRHHFPSMSERGGRSRASGMEGLGAIEILDADDLLGDVTSSRGFQFAVIAALAAGAIGLSFAAAR